MERRKVKHLHIIDNVKKILIIFLCLIITIIVFRMTYSSYETKATANADLGVAFFVLNEDFLSMTVNLNDKIEPGNYVPAETSGSVYNFDFKVMNYNDERRTEVLMYYDLAVRITTNLELDFDLLRNGTSCVASDVIARDVAVPSLDGPENVTANESTYEVSGDDVAYFRKITATREYFGFTEDEVDNYTLVVTFPSKYRDLMRYKSDDIIEGIEITVDAKQRINE